MMTIHGTRAFALRGLGCVAILSALAACSAGPPPNDVTSGVGFSDYQAYQARREALRNAPPAPAPARTPTRAAGQTALPPADVTENPFPVVATAEPVSAAVGDAWIPTETASATPPPARPITTPAPSVAPVRSAAPVTEAPSDVVDVAALAIAEAEAAAEARAASPELPPVAASADQFTAPPLPEGMVVLGANVVAFALSTNHAVGERVYGRFPLRLGRPEVRCSDFRTTDLAQDWFLTNGGPDRDRARLDPDGDGFACNWDPERYRMQAQTASQPDVAAPQTQIVSSSLSDG